MSIEGALEGYARAAAGEMADPFGKTSFRHAPISRDEDLYVGRIVPVLHYTMGGLRMDGDGRVLRADGSPIAGLSAAGEVTGGVHGNNRLGGNSLLDCVVFGRVAGRFCADWMFGKDGKSAGRAQREGQCLLNGVGVSLNS